MLVSEGQNLTGVFPIYSRINLFSLVIYRFFV